MTNWMAIKTAMLWKAVRRNWHHVSAIEGNIDRND